jgi:predicted site-specific integrase-resolvase
MATATKPVVSAKSAPKVEVVKMQEKGPEEHLEDVVQTLAEVERQLTGMERTHSVSLGVQMRCVRRLSAQAAKLADNVLDQIGRKMEVARKRKERELRTAQSNQKRVDRLKKLAAKLEAAGIDPKSVI